MIQQVDITGSIDGLQTAIDTVAGHDGIRGLMILAADANGFTPELLDPLLHSVPLPLFGGIFPEIIAGSEKLSKGSVVVGFDCAINLQRIDHISDPAVDFDQVIDELIPDIGSAKTMFIFVDAYCNRMGGLVESLFNIFGLELNYIGGGAGSINPIKLNLEQMPCILSNQGLTKDSAIMALVDINSSIGVKHGWNTILSGPHKVTEAEGNIIKTLDWRPAFEIYQEVISLHAGCTISPDNFFQVAKSYPFGIAKLESELIVRDPFGVTDDGGMIFISDIPQESFVNILTGNVKSLIDAAHKAYYDGIESCSDKENGAVMVVDCISRVLFLADYFSNEIGIMNKPGSATFGALTLGEIANSGKDYLEVYNKTCVVGVLDS